MVLFSHLMPELGALSYAKVLNLKKATTRESADTDFNRELIASKNQWDIKLYEYAQNRFIKQIAEQENWTDALNKFHRRCEYRAQKLQWFKGVYKVSDILRNKWRAEIRRRFLTCKKH